MHSPRFPHPSNIAHQNQWRPHGLRYGPRWPMQRPTHPINSRGEGTFPNNNEDYWCETCDRGFRTVDLLLNHKKQHQKCNIDGCQFIAHPKVITKHIQMQHSTGLYKKIAKLDNPEEIQKWIEERKKRYPTKTNIEKRKAEIKEKIDRGEKMGIRSYRENRPNQNGHGLKRKFGHDINTKKCKKRFQAKKSFNENNKNKALNENNKYKTLIQDNKKPSVSHRENELTPQMDNAKTLKPFAGILNLLEDIKSDNVEEDVKISDSIEDDEYILMDESNDKDTSTISEPVVCGALSSLICNYESSDEETLHNTPQLQDNRCENAMIQSNMKDQNESRNSKDNMHININIANDNEKDDNDSEPEETKIIKNPETDGLINQHVEQPKLEFFKNVRHNERHETNNINYRRNNTKHFRSKLPSTLLEKLLHNEIRQERNIILQCIRYIIKNNYFENTSTTLDSS